MGEINVKSVVKQKDLNEFTRLLLQDVKALDRMRFVFIALHRRVTAVRRSPVILNVLITVTVLVFNHL